MYSQRVKTWSKFGLIAILVIIAVLYRYSDKTAVAPVVPEADTQTPKVVKFVGLVQENVNQLPVDGNASLRILRSDDTIATVTYEWGGLTPEGTPTCQNKVAAAAGAAVKERTPVEVYARVTGANTYSTCEDQSYYIRPSYH